MTKKPKIKSLGIEVIALLFLANLTGSYYWVKTHTMAAACIDVTTVSTDSRCLYILTGKVFEMGSRNNPHRGHPCGMDVTSIMPGNHSANVSKYLDPRYRADLCTASVPTNTPKPTNTSIPTATNTPKPTNTTAPLATNTPKPTNTLTPIPTNTLRPTNTATPKPTIPGSPTNTPTLRPTNTSIPTATNTPKPTNTTAPLATNTPKPTNTATPKPTVPGSPTNTPTLRPTNTSIPKPTNTIPMVTEALAQASPTTAAIAIVDKCFGVDLNNDGIVNSMDYLACNKNEVTPTPPISTIEPAVVSPMPTAGVEIGQPSSNFFASLGFAAWWGVVLAMASAGTLVSTLLLGVVKAMSTTITDNLAAGKFKPAAAPTENNLVINKGDVIDKLFYITYFGGIDDNSCWVNLSGNEGLILGKLNQPKVTEGFYKVTGFTVTTAVNPYIAIEKIVPLEKNG